MIRLQLPHWADLAVSLVVCIIAWVAREQNSGALTLPATAITALTLVSLVLGTLSTSANPAANMRAAVASGDAVATPQGKSSDTKGTP